MGLLVVVGGGGSGYTKRMDDGWMCSEKCVKTINATTLNEWIWLGCVCVCGGGRCENVWLHKEDRGWVDVLGEVCGNHQWLPH